MSSELKSLKQQKIGAIGIDCIVFKYFLFYSIQTIYVLFVIAKHIKNFFVTFPKGISGFYIELSY